MGIPRGRAATSLRLCAFAPLRIFLLNSEENGNIVPVTWLLLYLLVFAFATLMGAGFTFAARAAALRFGVLDKPAGRKDHAKPIAVSGGWAIFGAFALAVGAGGTTAPFFADSIPSSLDPLGPYLRNLQGMRFQLAAVLGGAAWIFAIGAVDDVKPLGPRFKLFAQIVAALPLLAAGVSIRGFLPLPIGWGLTIFWTVLLMNSLNFMDNMDGLCATVGAVIALVLALAGWMGGQLWLPAAAVCLAGILVGFLFFNFHPATIFLGDSGALTLGYLLSALSIMTTYYSGEEPTGLPILIPLAVMGVPLFDTASVMFIRWRNGAPFMVGDRNHFSHRLRAMGFSIRQTALVIGLLTGAVGALSLALRHLGPMEATLHLGGLIALFGVIAALEFIGRTKS